MWAPLPSRPTTPNHGRLSRGHGALVAGASHQKWFPAALDLRRTEIDLVAQRAHALARLNGIRTLLPSPSLIEAGCPLHDLVFSLERAHAQSPSRGRSAPSCPLGLPLPDGGCLPLRWKNTGRGASEWRHAPLSGWIGIGARSGGPTSISGRRRRRRRGTRGGRGRRDGRGRGGGAATSVARPAL